MSNETQSKSRRKVTLRFPIPIKQISDHEIEITILDNNCAVFTEDYVLFMQNAIGNREADSLLDQKAHELLEEQIRKSMRLCF